MPELTGLGTVKLACDVMGHELKSVSHFGHYNPEPGGQKSVDKYKRAITISLEWANI